MRHRTARVDLMYDDHWQWNHKLFVTLTVGRPIVITSMRPPRCSLFPMATFISPTSSRLYCEESSVRCITSMNGCRSAHVLLAISWILALFSYTYVQRGCASSRGTAPGSPQPGWGNLYRCILTRLQTAIKLLPKGSAQTLHSSTLIRYRSSSFMRRRVRNAVQDYVRALHDPDVEQRQECFIKPLRQLLPPPRKHYSERDLVKYSSQVTYHFSDTLATC